MECGVWRGGSAKLLYERLGCRAPDKHLHLFDSFEGMAQANAVVDRHEAGDFSDTSLPYVRGFVLGADAAPTPVTFTKGGYRKALQALSI